MKIATIHVYLPEEAVDCWYPVRAESLGEELYRLIDPPPSDPVLEFGQGAVVRSGVKWFSGDGAPDWNGLTAYEKISDRGNSKYFEKGLLCQPQVPASPTHDADCALQHHASGYDRWCS